MVDGGGTEAAGRVADVLLAFLDGPRSLGVSAIARRLDLSKAVVHRILQTLVQRGLLAPDPTSRGYLLGPAAAAVGARALRDSDLRTVAMPVLRELQRVTGETTTLSALVPGGRVYLDQVESTSEIKMTVELGRLFPLHAGSSSVCMLAFLPDDQIDAVLAGPLERLTDRTLVDPRDLRQRLAEVRRRGYASSEGERQAGAGSVAAPVFGLDGLVEGAISVCGPAARVDAAARDRFVPLLISAADSISRARGWRGGLPTPKGRPIA
jgi:IclR family transcriptional regulator, acetate operon repressor